MAVLRPSVGPPCSLQRKEQEGSKGARGRNALFSRRQRSAGAVQAAALKPPGCGAELEGRFLESRSLRAHLCRRLILRSGTSKPLISAPAASIARIARSLSRMLYERGPMEACGDSRGGARVNVLPPGVEWRPNFPQRRPG